ncbi:MAG: hypothetical protein AB8G16_19640 [Gammaproteobacteria bacterium]
MTDLYMDMIGWIGAVLLLAPYLLLSLGKMEGRSTPYQALNVAGSAALIANSAYYGAFPSAAVNVVWIIIGTATLVALAKDNTKHE